VLELEPQLRWGLYLCAFTALAVWETLRPRKQLVASTPWRWCGNASLTIATQFLLVWLVPIGAIVTASTARGTGWGLLNHPFIPLPLQGLLAILALDFARYGQHYLFHAIGPLWRIHRIHHSDVDMDLTTGVRHHPLEVVLSAATYLPVVGVLGAPALAVVGYELFLIFHAFFSHANIDLPAPLDGLLRRLVVTPDMHRVHHSDRAAESQRNYGLAFPFWDRLFGTYQDQPQDGHRDMGLGIKGFQDSRSLNVLRILGWPFHDSAMGSDKADGQLMRQRPNS
jgi:sterol desaturase/sphingolipid hydroxylase (fatty acid hydroxylase superfamily)